PLADWRGNRPLQADLRLTNGGDDFFRQDGAVLFENGQSGLMNVPIKLNARRLKDATSRLSDLWSGSITRNQRDSVRHVSSVKCPHTCVIWMQNSCSGGQLQFAASPWAINDYSTHGRNDGIIGRTNM